ncbi:hypothetical protein [Shouchella hunanensis]|uniref:Uncharacterized protein n=1 Tax=Shouchella hunanensis TaxID=766894 RepID=A0ABY7W8C4_9BACI|nr:hypothetical protein [Shouchella hunanensis]WDF02940.1 hypothetical protein PQ477_15750 [Shouchella hunanensis]
MNKKYIIMSVSLVTVLALGACSDNESTSSQDASSPSQDQGQPSNPTTEKIETEPNHSIDSDALFESYEESRSESDYDLSQMQEIIYTGMDYNTYIDETMFEFMIAEGYFNDTDDKSFDVWIAQDGFLGVEVTPDNGVLDILEFSTMIEADEYGSANYY